MPKRPSLRATCLCSLSLEVTCKSIYLPIVYYLLSLSTPQLPFCSCLSWIHCHSSPIVAFLFSIPVGESVLLLICFGRSAVKWPRWKCFRNHWYHWAANWLIYWADGWFPLPHCKLMFCKLTGFDFYWRYSGRHCWPRWTICSCYLDSTWTARSCFLTFAKMIIEQYPWDYW